MTGWLFSNEIAWQVIKEVRGQHPVYVFTGKDGKHRIHGMNNYAWKKARKTLKIPVRIHDLKHTFGRRLRAAQVSHEDRQDLLGHKSSRITTHYSPAEVKNLIDAANKVCHREISTPTLTSIRTTANQVITIADRIQDKDLSTKVVNNCISLCNQNG